MNKPATKEDLLKFNINHSVFVKLNREGYEIWMNYYNNCFITDFHRKSIDYYINKSDENGYVKFQTWEFMQIFGNDIIMGRQTPFHTDVFFYAKELEDCR